MAGRASWPWEQAVSRPRLRGAPLLTAEPEEDARPRGATTTLVPLPFGVGAYRALPPALKPVPVPILEEARAPHVRSSIQLPRTSHRLTLLR